MIQADKRETTRGEKAAVGSPRVLLVQSDPDLRDTLTLACQEAGLHVHNCATVALAQEACRRLEMDLIVVDWVVEGLFADDLLKFLEAAFHPRSLPTTLVLSSMDDADTRDCLRPGSPIQGVLTRPTNFEEFVAWAPTFAAVLKKTHECMTG
ncbi:MAG: response regulator [Planctomycetota bacterium]